jgi:hypothetical protein
MQHENQNHAEVLKKREKELHEREMNLLEREINIIIQVRFYTSIHFNSVTSPEV